MLLKLIGSTYYFMGNIYKLFFFFPFTIMKSGKATKAVIRNEELGTCN